jgi:hypothetical protein
VIALDHLGASPGGVSADEFKSLLLPNLIEPILKGQLERVRLVLIVNQDESVRFGISELENRVQVVDVKAFPPELFLPLTRLFLRRHNLANKKSEDFVSAAAQTVAEPWKPEKLHLIKEFLSHGP